MAEFFSLHDAVQKFVHDGATVTMEGFTHLIPFAAGHEVIRQQKRDLTLIRMTPDLIYDQLIGAGCAKKVIFSWGGNPGVGSLHRLRDAVEKGWIWGWLKKGFKGKKNPDLWQRFIVAYKKHEVRFQWVKGHAGIPENERCDQLAVEAAQGANLLIDQGYEQSI